MMATVSEITHSFPISYSLLWELDEIPLLGTKPFQTVIVLDNKYMPDNYESQPHNFNLFIIN